MVVFSCVFRIVFPDLREDYDLRWRRVSYDSLPKGDNLTLRKIIVPRVLPYNYDFVYNSDERHFSPNQPW